MRFRKSYEILGYAYEAAIHCVPCANGRFGPEALAAGTAVDREGNTVTPLFLDQSDDTETCGTCRGPVS